MKQIPLVIDESIKLELNVSELYSLFQRSFPEDADFWWELVLEEKNHAALIQSGKEHFEPITEFPPYLLHHNLQELEDINSDLLALIKQFENTPPLRAEAFNLALKIENSAGELHFQEFMNKEEDLIIGNIFRKLNKDDKEHAMRIRTYMQEHGISVQE
ncbi:MAG: hypothetical protein OEV89_00935 [Desulfobulbaceae bacterium]|nr:hypothetical protein [Desulfobulbaceae bacterium]HIJ89408.1 rubrerythrin family protein [Deltaproteobacteria bacterium]